MADTKTTIYITAYLIVYAVAAAILVSVFNEPVKDILTVFILLGAGFSLVAWHLTKNIHSNINEKPAFAKEAGLLILLIAWIVLYITYGSGFIDSLIPKNILQNQQAYFLIILVRKLLVFVMVPFLLYQFFGCSLKDFGLCLKRKEIFTQRNILIFLCLSIMALAFQYYLSTGGKNFRHENFSALRLIKGFPFVFTWLLIEAGLVEEFFFRGLLQSRLAMVLKSPAGGIVISGLIFGLVHAPGLYLRGAESEGIDEQMPFHFFVAYTIVYMSIAGIFLGIVYNYQVAANVPLSTKRFHNYLTKTSYPQAGKVTISFPFSVTFSLVK